MNDFYTWPVQPALDADGNEVRVDVKFPNGLCHVKVWRLKIGRVDLLLLDTNIAENESADYRDVTDELYGGDNVTRIRQEPGPGRGRAARAQGAGPGTDRVPHERGPLGVSGAGADPSADAGALT